MKDDNLMVKIYRVSVISLPCLLVAEVDALNAIDDKQRQNLFYQLVAVPE
jgi:hypothetical protein